MMRLARAIPKDGILVEEGLTSADDLPAIFPIRDRKSFFGNVSGGIGWGIAAAVGVQIAEPERRVVAVIGDGSAMYSITALWSAANQKLPVIFLIMQQRGLPDPQEPPEAVPRQRQADRHGLQRPADGHHQIAEGFGVTAERVDTADGFDAALEGAGQDRRPEPARGDGEEGRLAWRRRSASPGPGRAPTVPAVAFSARHPNDRSPARS
jgi:benzoylformate decarboxylase